MTRDGTDRLEFALRCMLIEALHMSRGSGKQAARVLGISQRKLNYLMGQHGLRIKDGIEWQGSRLEVTEQRAEEFFAEYQRAAR